MLIVIVGVVALMPEIAGRQLSTPRGARDVTSLNGAVDPGTSPRKSPVGALRFSTDGTHVLALRPGRVTVLRTNPFSVAFEITRPIFSATFSLDSSEVIVLSGPSSSTNAQTVLHAGRSLLERWRIKDAKMVESRQVEYHACQSTAVSPGFNAVACLDSTGSFRIVDIRSSETLLERSKFSFDGRIVDSQTGMEYDWPNTAGVGVLQFSPDGRFLLTVPLHGRALAYDIVDRREVHIGGGLKRLVGQEFTFLASNQLLSASSWGGRKGIVNGKVLEFPSGKLMAKVKIPPGPLRTATNCEFVLISPFGRSTDGQIRSAAIEVKTGFAIISDTPALDVFGRRYVAELKNGDIGLYEIGNGLVASVRLPYR